MACALSCASQKNAQVYFEEGAKLLEQGEIDKAIASYTQGLNIEPRSEVGHNLLGMAYRFKFNATHDPQYRELEIESFENALEINPDYVFALVNLGATYYYSGRKEKAAELFTRALEVYPEHPEAEMLKKMIEEAQ
jgi:tetratricopeptide (TPR) repeat protein